ncbi:hypothetical protein [Xenorhabdus hominickii]|uniref:Uncharacterized protein n=1 Tax=Xenorhabdus hominickii TaxID=351679 RepID=A0A2G0QFG8_XENHO|nr:hypothetical protein [Xenorhabdus hominickii]AOM41993.1 hypothetical protein A9255_16350 [Xenorhabdus hominickii]PHM57975.1 hypothetical protein Xhom_00979 [Xenorhabdus hominickii]
MIDKENIVDGIIITHEDNPNKKLIFNFYSWVEVLKAIIVKYANKSESEAEYLVLNHPAVYGYKNSYMSVALLGHESEYDWAMLMAYGHEYWEKGVPAYEPEGFDEWLEQYKKEHNLARFIFE